MAVQVESTPAREAVVTIQTDNGLLEFISKEEGIQVRLTATITEVDDRVTTGRLITVIKRLDLLELSTVLTELACEDILDENSAE